MAIGIDVSIYAKTELLLSPLGVRIVAYRGMCSEDAIDSMEEASEKLDEAIELLNDIV